MRRFFVFALTMFFATTFLFLTNGYSSYDSDYKYGWLFEGVYGDAYVSMYYSEPFVGSNHSFWVLNDGPGTVKYYTTATIEVYWAGGGSITPIPKEDSGIIEAGSSGGVNESFMFSLRNKRKGQGYAWASSALEVRHIPTSVKRSLPTASASITFEIR